MRADPQRLFRCGFSRQQRIVVERVELLSAHLDAVLQAVERRLHDALFSRTGLAKLNVAAAQLGGSHQRKGQSNVSLELQLSTRLQAGCGAGIAGNEHQLVGAGSGKVDLQKIRGPCGLVVFVSAQDGKIERPARKLKVVRIAPECGDISLRCKNQAHIRKALVLVEKELPPLVELY